MSRSAILLLGCIAFLVLTWFCISRHMEEIPADIKSRAEATFKSSSLDHIGLTIDGRDLLLNGIVETPELKEEASIVAKTISGVRLVDNQLMVVASVVQVEEQTEGTAETPASEPDWIDVTGPDETAPVLQDVTQEVVQAANQRCEKELAKLLSEERILFGSGSAEISTASLPLLERIVTAAKQCPDSHIVVEGHTDDSGSDELNMEMSQKRAKAVADHLRNAGLTQPIESMGYGELRPITSNDTEIGKTANRRIEFKVLSRKRESVQTPEKNVEEGAVMTTTTPAPATTDVANPTPSDTAEPQPLETPPATNIDTDKED